MANSLKQRYTKEADRYWQIVIVGKAGKRCEKCASAFMVSGHHINKRRHMTTRWAISNGIALCQNCHNYAEVNPREFNLWLSHFFRDRWLSISHRVTQFMVHEIKEIRDHLKKLADKYQ